MNPSLFLSAGASFSDEAAGDLPGAVTDLTAMLVAPSREASVAAQLAHHAEERSLVCTDAWLDKCLEVLAATKLGSITLLVGAPGTGKSKCFDTLLLAIDAPGTTHRVCSSLRPCL
jgi:hypothetical protein